MLCDILTKTLSLTSDFSLINMARMRNLLIGAFPPLKSWYVFMKKLIVMARGPGKEMEDCLLWERSRA